MKIGLMIFFALLIGFVVILAPPFLGFILAAATAAGLVHFAAKAGALNKILPSSGAPAIV